MRTDVPTLRLIHAFGSPGGTVHRQSGGHFGLALEKTWGGAQSITGDVRNDVYFLLQISKAF